MGTCQSKKDGRPRQSIKGLEDDDVDRDALRESVHMFRKSMAWYRYGVNFHDKYSILEVIGTGSLGEVSMVQKKPSERLKNSYALARTLEDSTGSAERACRRPRSRSMDSLDRTWRRGATCGAAPTYRRFAAKSVATRRMSDPEIAEFINEIEILRDLDHPNIIQLFEVFRVKRQLWLVMELCTGGGLMERALAMDERGAADVIGQVLHALTHMHAREVCHRDIKLENILFANERDNVIKLIDFGFSALIEKGQALSDKSGTVYTASPETLLGLGSSLPTDIWSVGVVAFILLGQTYPFARDFDEMQYKKEKLRNAQYQFGPKFQTRHVSRCGHEFVTLSLRKYPESRWTAAQALDFVATEWIPAVGSLRGSQNSFGVTKRTVPEHVDTRTEPDDNRGKFTKSLRRQSLQLIDKSNVGIKGGIVIEAVEPCSSFDLEVEMKQVVMDGMKNFSKFSELKQFFLLILAFSMDKSNLDKLRELFLGMVADDTGTITLRSFRTFIGGDLSDHEIDEIFRALDIDKSGNIHYVQFLAANLESEGLLTPPRLAETFERLDTDNSGVISKQNLSTLLGLDDDEAVVDRMMAEVDAGGDGVIGYDEFLAFVLGISVAEIAAAHGNTGGHYGEGPEAVEE
eukprot:CAMPEP_0194312680 /NCGR_PEP_ID=MMETSP0171-20130528/9612_1 /TAXON_ID=218684 /ORGANISM="Corethron pennatum, Strain L29A3" /LENGTH=630 /DNA_ID=CAMNT_0039067303 /DNA_START=269 /DNA_END=2161 /DNA_ORIENTATION=+